MNQGHGSVGSGLGSDRMAITRVVRAHSRLRQADCDAGQAALGNSGQEVGSSGAPGHGCGRGKMARRLLNLAMLFRCNSHQY